MTAADVRTRRSPGPWWWRGLLAAVVLAGCGGKPTPPPRDPDPPPPPTRQAVDDGDEDEDDGLEVLSNRGKFAPEVVERALGRHASAFEACYAEQVGRRRWLGGGVELTWEVAADGALAGVRLSHSDLGAWSIERCLLDVARGVSFGKPRGGKAKVVTPLAFSAGAGAVPWSEAQATRAAGPRLKELAPCAKSAAGVDPTNVTVTLYVGTRGKVQSVGFASPTGFDDAWAECAAGKAMAWALADPRGKVAKLSLIYNPAELPDVDDEDQDDEE